MLKVVARGFYHRAAEVGQRILRRSSIPKQQERQKLKILFFVNKNNGLSQRVAQELRERSHVIEICEIIQSDQMTQLANEKQPDMILCPFLTKRVPEEVWSNPRTPCLIVHPGIAGDRGASSIDWALKERSEAWGVTVMQAAEEMDAGNIWSTVDFTINRPNINTLTKSSLYNIEVTKAAVHNCLRAIDNFIGNINPRPLDYSLPYVRGRLRPNMKKTDRIVDWDLPMEEVACQVRMSDSSPGAVARIRVRGTESEWSEEMRIFGAHLEESNLQNVDGVPGEIIGQRDNGVLVKCGKGAVWISHIKKNKLKLPATFWLPGQHRELPKPSLEIPYKTFPKTFQEIWTTISPDGVCNVHFGFMNGAMSTSQCRRLELVLKTVEQDERVKVIVLRGGHDMFSNGIHLNVIESASNPSAESWANINAIDDVVKAIFTSKKVILSGVHGNAGAGGAMMALASDIAVSRDGVVFNPNYHRMCLHGSEYHSFFLPLRVGETKARELLTSQEPLLSSEAVRIGFLNDSYGQTLHEFDSYVEDLSRELAHPAMIKEHRINKKKFQNDEWFGKLEEHKRQELTIMAENFESEDYHNARKAFVYH